MLDVLIKDVRILDGSGEPAYTGNVGIKDGKILLGNLSNKAREVVEGKGRYLTPGFIDSHSHGDMVVGKDFAQLSKSCQGITTEIAGQCGLSMAPTNREYLGYYQNNLLIAPDAVPKESERWNDYANFVEYVKAQPKSAHIKIFVGHATLRIAVMGMANRKATEEELSKMKDLLVYAMENGAVGMSTGLIYPPSTYAPTEELIELAKAMKPYNGIYASHMRNESGEVVEAVKETIDIGRQAGVPVFISHHKVLGKYNWGLQKETLRLVDEAVAEGIRVTLDQYPYTRNMTHLNACIPPWHYSDGTKGLTKRLADPKVRATIKAEMANPDTKYDNYYLNAGGWSGVLVTTSPVKEVEGLTIREYAEKLGKDEFETFFDLMQESGCHGTAVYSSMCDEDVFDIIKNPNTVVGTDGITQAANEKGHPRAYGSFPRALNYFVKENNILPLEEMVHRMTGLTAERLGIANKGLIREGYDADLVLLDYDHLEDVATYINPLGRAKGIDKVFVDGIIVYEDGKMTGKTPGKYLYHYQK